MDTAQTKPLMANNANGMYTYTVYTLDRKTLPEAQRTQGIASKLELSLQQNRMSLALVKN